LAGVSLGRVPGVTAGAGVCAAAGSMNNSSATSTVAGKVNMRRHFTLIRQSPRKNFFKGARDRAKEESVSFR
jgi:hypothetical protein